MVAKFAALRTLLSALMTLVASLCVKPDTEARVGERSMRVSTFNMLVITGEVRLQG